MAEAAGLGFLMNDPAAFFIGTALFNMSVLVTATVAGGFVPLVRGGSTTSRERRTLAIMIMIEAGIVIVNLILVAADTKNLAVGLSLSAVSIFMGLYALRILAVALVKTGDERDSAGASCQRP
jgi:hypothetical protein